MKFSKHFANKVKLDLERVCTGFGHMEMFWTISRRTAYSKMMDLYDWKSLVILVRNIFYLTQGGFFLCNSTSCETIFYLEVKSGP